MRRKKVARRNRAKGEEGTKAGKADGERIRDDKEENVKEEKRGKNTPMREQEEEL